MYSCLKITTTGTADMFHRVHSMEKLNWSMKLNNVLDIPSFFFIFHIIKFQKTNEKICVQPTNLNTKDTFCQ